MQADDDGVVEAFSVMRTTGATEDDLRVLASKGFVSVLNDDLVTYITDWSRNNYIQKDRYHPSIYKEILVKLADGSTMDTGCIQGVSGMDTQVRLGKDRLGKGSIGDSGADKPPRRPRFVPPTVEQVAEYVRSRNSNCGAGGGCYPSGTAGHSARTVHFAGNCGKRERKRPGPYISGPEYFGV